MYIYNHANGGELSSLPVVVRVWHTDEDGNEYDVTHRLHERDGRIVSDTGVDGDAYEVVDWNSDYTSVDSDFGWEDIFELLYMQHELNQRVHSVVVNGPGNGDPLAELLREIVK